MVVQIKVIKLIIIKSFKNKVIINFLLQYKKRVKVLKVLIIICKIDNL